MQTDLEASRPGPSQDKPPVETQTASSATSTPPQNKMRMSLVFREIIHFTAGNVFFCVIRVLLRECFGLGLGLVTCGLGLDVCGFVNITDVYSHRHLPV